MIGKDETKHQSVLLVSYLKEAVWDRWKKHDAEGVHCNHVSQNSHFHFYSHLPQSFLYACFLSPKKTRVCVCVCVHVSGMRGGRNNTDALCQGFFLDGEVELWDFKIIFFVNFFEM